MGKMLCASVLWILASVAFAQEITCLDKLLPYSRYSGLHQLTKEEWGGGHDVLTAEDANNALKALVNGKLLCRPEEIVIKVEPLCQTIAADLPSTTCYLFTNVGYFFISRDNGKNTNFVFSKDKRFADPIR